MAAVSSELDRVALLRRALADEGDGRVLLGIGDDVPGRCSLRRLRCWWDGGRGGRGGALPPGAPLPPRSRVPGDHGRRERSRGHGRGAARAPGGAGAASCRVCDADLEALAAGQARGRGPAGDGGDRRQPRRAARSCRSPPPPSAPQRPAAHARRRPPGRRDLDGGPGGARGGRAPGPGARRGDPGDRGRRRSVAASEGSSGRGASGEHRARSATTCPTGLPATPGTWPGRAACASSSTRRPSWGTSSAPPLPRWGAIPWRSRSTAARTTRWSWRCPRANPSKASPGSARPCRATAAPRSRCAGRTGRWRRSTSGALITSWRIAVRPPILFLLRTSWKHRGTILVTLAALALRLW